MPYPPFGMARWHRSIIMKKVPVQEAPICDIWDLIHYRCPLSKLEARILIRRYIFGKGERELAADLGLPWRAVNRATWRMKGKLRGQMPAIRELLSMSGTLRGIDLA